MSSWSKVFLIALRVVVGWHFLYEGLWKIDSHTGSTTYSTARYTLQANTARLRDYFEGSGTLQLEPALKKVDAWHDDIVKAFAARKALGEDQKARLATLRDNVKLAARDAVNGNTALDDVVNFDWPYVHEEVLKIAAEGESEQLSSLGYLQGSAGPLRGVFRSLVPDIEGLERLTLESAHSRLDERHREILQHFRSAGKPFTREQEKRLEAGRNAIKQSVGAALTSPAFRSRLADYRLMLGRVKKDASGLDAPFTRERLAADRKKLDTIAGEMLALVNEPLAELAVQTQAIATVEQFTAGPLPTPSGPADWVDKVVPWVLTGIGACLMLGLFTPFAAVAAAGQLAVFYFASPPWPGLPAANLGGHYMFVDRNLIELVAALAIAATSWTRNPEPAEVTTVGEHHESERTDAPAWQR